MSVTGNAMEADKCKFSGAGIDGLIIKPVKAASLVAEVRSLLQARARG